MLCKRLEGKRKRRWSGALNEAAHSENTPTRNMDYVYFLLIALDCDGLVYYGQVT
jgi:hypothetical protein